MASSRYLQKVNEQLIGGERWKVLRDFHHIIETYEEAPEPLQDVYSRVARLFNHDLSLLDGFEEYLQASYPTHQAQVLAAQTERNETHKRACERQSKSPLMTLPREIRDKIWDIVIDGNVIHVSPKLEKKVTHEGFFSKRRRKSRTYLFHACQSAKGLRSSACPPGEGDHDKCLTTGRSNHYYVRLVCKQLLLELPNAKTTFFSGNAFQFGDLQTADAFLFGLAEPQRSSITHLRLAVSEDIVTGAHGNDYELLQGILNYFSNPWDRETLHFERETPDQLKAPVYFYYSSCYFENNRDRLYVRCQVARDNGSHDVGISDLKWKGRPNLDLAMKVTTDEMDEDTWTTDFENPRQWVRSLLQFRQYDGLTFQLYNNDGLVSSPQFATFTKALKEYMVEPVIGPRGCMFITGHPSRGFDNDVYGRH